MQSKLADLERKLQDCKKDNARLRLINTEVECDCLFHINISRLYCMFIMC